MEAKSDTVLASLASALRTFLRLRGSRGHVCCWPCSTHDSQAQQHRRRSSLSLSLSRVKDSAIADAFECPDVLACFGFFWLKRIAGWRQRSRQQAGTISLTA
eukprot:3773789-Pyramimonas_sp.AAC.1